VLESAPAIHEQEDGDRAKPTVAPPKRQPNECGNTDKSEQCGYQQTSGAAHHEPEQRTENLAAIKRVDREDIERQQPNIDPENRVKQRMQVGDGRIPAQQKAHPADDDDDRR
jgi:hypothetical protein